MALLWGVMWGWSKEDGSSQEGGGCPEEKWGNVSMSRGTAVRGSSRRAGPVLTDFQIGHSLL